MKLFYIICLIEAELNPKFDWMLVGHTNVKVMVFFTVPFETNDNSSVKQTFLCN
jgi:hypothetical protein